jgi:four helix bundle protein
MKPLFALELALEFYHLSSGVRLPLHLRNQFLKAASSIAMNLSEGAAKPTLADRKRFYYISLGSLRECQTILKLQKGVSSELVRKLDFLGICVYRLCKAPE